MFSRCRVVGCGRPARAGTDDGLDTRFCRSHSDHYARHGSPYRRSYTAKEITPYREAAMRWLEANADDLWVRNAIDRVKTLYRTAGAHQEAYRLRGLSPEARANAAWARLRKAKIDPRRVVAAWLAVVMIIRDDPQAETTTEYKRVQAAKLIHKMASGTHKRWAKGQPQRNCTSTRGRAAKCCAISGRALRQRSSFLWTTGIWRSGKSNPPLGISVLSAAATDVYTN